MATVESKVVDAILQRKTMDIEIEGMIYPVGPPSVATLLLVSEIISGLKTDIDIHADTPERIVVEVLRTAKDFHALGDIAAILILGAERILEKILVERRRVVLDKGFSFRKLRTVPVRKELFEIAEEKEVLAGQILLHCRSGVLKELITERLKNMEISAFFGLTTSLAEINMLKPTREVEEETTTSGQ